METYTENEIIELIGNDKNINFLAAAITPWHALGIDALIYQLLQRGIILQGYIMIVMHSVSGNIINEENFSMREKAGIKIIQVMNNNSDRTVKRKIENKINKYCYYMNWHHGDNQKQLLYWAVPLQPSYELIPQIAKRKKMCNLQIIVTDEGLGSYINTPLVWWKCSFVESGIKAGIKATWHILFRDQYFKYSLQRKKQIHYSQLLIKKGGKWIPNKEAITAYRYILELREYKEDFSAYENAILINSDMLYESGLLKKAVDIEIYKKICDAISSQGIKIILKPHPREKQLDRYDELGCIVEKNNIIAQENILAVLKRKPLCVIGIESTTLVTAKLLFGIEAISLGHLIRKKEFREESHVRNFYKTFHEFLYLPKNLEETIEIITDIIKRNG